MMKSLLLVSAFAMVCSCQLGTDTSSTSDTTPKVSSGLGIVLERAPTQTDWIIAEIAPGSPADAAGLRVGDVVTSINGVAIHDFADADFAAARDSMGGNALVEMQHLGVGQSMVVSTRPISSLFSAGTFGPSSTYSCPCRWYCFPDDCGASDLDGEFCSTCNDCHCV